MRWPIVANQERLFVDRATDLTTDFSEDRDDDTTNGGTFELFEEGSAAELVASVSYPESTAGRTAQTVLDQNGAVVDSQPKRRSFTVTNWQ